MSIDRYAPNGADASAAEAAKTPKEPSFDCGAAIRTDVMQEFVQNFSKSSRRWEVVVYPALFAFIVLAAYGFYLIFSLTRDMHVMANSVQQMTTEVQTMAVTMEDVSVKLNTLKPMLAKMGSMDGSMGGMDHTMKRMNTSVQAMSVSTDKMRHEMTIMSRNVARPMSIMNSFMP
jgi:uncharacterized protein YoxC